MATSSRNRWLGLVMLSLGLSMIIVDVSIVNVAIPVIIEDLKIDFTTAEWVNTTYSLVFAALLVTLGRLGDLVGRRRVYIGGLVVFASPPWPPASPRTARCWWAPGCCRGSAAPPSARRPCPSCRASSGDGSGASPSGSGAR